MHFQFHPFWSSKAWNFMFIFPFTFLKTGWYQLLNISFLSTSKILHSGEK
uniref:Uncharacterized protein n=1 Tax=Rhizophora mucronata TaxID=61149 RepID=A0A2P2QC87_RHIMU